MGENRLTSRTFTTSGTWSPPAGVTFAQFIGVGGGGGGGSGGSCNLYNAGCGGGGGGGAILGMCYAAVIPGATYTITLGSGGVGGTAVTGDINPGNNGGDGGDTLIKYGFSNFIEFKGAAGGCGGGYAGTLTPIRVNGGMPTKSANAAYYVTYSTMPDILPIPGQGGYSWFDMAIGPYVTLDPTLMVGGASPLSAGGLGGGLSTNNNYGSGGGGGGASGWSPYNTVGNGGAGSTGAINASSGTAGSYGSGGGGGGGAYNNTSYTSGAGGSGGAGAVIIIWST